MTNGAASGGISELFDVVRWLEKERGSRIWCVLHCNYGHICYPTGYSILSDRDQVGTGDLIEILLHTGGGHPDIAYRVMKFFRRRFKRVNVLVPLAAKSAGTIMCFGADNIFVGENADFGPIDIQIDDNVKHGEKSFSPLDEFKSFESMREQAIEWMDYYATVMNVKYGMSIKEALKDSVPLVTGLMQPIMQQIDPVEMGGYRRAIAIGEEYATRMLTLTGHPNATAIVERFVWGYPSHDFCIDFDEAHELGLPVQRLPEEQDRRLVAALLQTERGMHHGFVPAPSQTAPSPQPRPVRKGRRATTPIGNTEPISGSNGGSPQERVGTEGSVVESAPKA